MPDFDPRRKHHNRKQSYVDKWSVYLDWTRLYSSTGVDQQGKDSWALAPPTSTIYQVLYLYLWIYYYILFVFKKTYA